MKERLEKIEAREIREINPALVVLADEYIDHQAERFLFWNVRELLGISFARFLDDPDRYVGEAARSAMRDLMCGWAERLHA